MSFLREYTLPNHDEILQQFLAELDNPDWEEPVEVNNTNISLRNMFEYGGIRAWKAVGLIKRPPPDVLRELMNVSTRKLWDPLCIQAQPVETVDAQADIVQLSFRSGPAAPRDFCLWRHKITQPDGTIIILVQSLYHPRAAEQKGFVRGNVPIAGYRLQPFGTRPPPPPPEEGEEEEEEEEDPGFMIPKKPVVEEVAPETMATLMVHADLKTYFVGLYQHARTPSVSLYLFPVTPPGWAQGWVPRFVLDEIAQREPGTIAALREKMGG
ncbi:hypothetical protein PAPYR_10357 [Paratrimastix pyriformis]|uniref:START domain-containing protein n=1 Tax=Paratrimastix pyriformis TaxID=342808 RepID=A0ABQ8U9Z2_9EUKA|nr:hypothetical protein PAPYR_10357 [Paratrimastix pyriformis]